MNMHRTLLALSASVVALSGTAEAAVNVQVWTNVPTSVSQNATIAQAAGLGAPNVTTTVSGLNFSTLDSSTTTVGQWLGNPAISTTILNNAYFLFTGSILLNAGANPFTVAHDDGLELSLDGGIGTALSAPGPTPPTTTPFAINAPAAGTYNFTLSYGECCAGPAVLQFLYPTGEAVGSVPEPATWVMMLLGFGGIGMAMRRRRRALSLPQLA